ncbi:hypothetical protein TW95_gp1775 [Pandoravirus inopinatum]|uniref:Uncharacterized protein n=1 Tax=Pandoravirus inopinatum TaxID=1605721 RepID=A0A0B5J4E1_9VIRU|nr:hypothetical protein TW95_gp1775 [Pandoravirus inopinatum]AJF98509.1 hypothetical protein [Pandoravirus inopinatum]
MPHDAVPDPLFFSFLFRPPPPCSWRAARRQGYATAARKSQSKREQKKREGEKATPGASVAIMFLFGKKPGDSPGGLWTATGQFAPAHHARESHTVAPLPLPHQPKSCYRSFFAFFVSKGGGGVFGRVWRWATARSFRFHPVPILKSWFMIDFFISMKWEGRAIGMAPEADHHRGRSRPAR